VWDNFVFARSARLIGLNQPGAAEVLKTGLPKTAVSATAAEVCSRFVSCETSLTP
jgi:hypothetical protein